MKLRVFLIFLCFTLFGSAHQLLASASQQGTIQKTQPFSLIKITGVQEQSTYTVVDADDEDENEDENETFLRKLRLQANTAFTHALLINDHAICFKDAPHVLSTASDICIFQRVLRI